MPAFSARFIAYTSRADEMTATSSKSGISLKYMESRIAWSLAPSPETNAAALTISNLTLSSCPVLV